MSTYRFEEMLSPRTVAVVGAGERPNSVGRMVMAAIRAGGFSGDVFPINPNHAEVAGERCLASVSETPRPPDLVVIATPPETVPEIVERAGARGAAAAIVLSAHLGQGESDPIGEARRAARKYGLRLLGPDSIGIAAPAGGLNATLLARPPKAGDVALISHSGTVASAIAEWAGRRGVGFSGIMTLGRAADIDSADCLDHFAGDIRTRAILLSLSHVHDARKFLSAARAAARVKPVVVLRVGRHELARAADGGAPTTHTGALARPDAVYAAAFRRAGLLVVDDLDSMFSAVETLSRHRPFPGKRLMVVSNGRGIGALAADRLTDLGGTLAEPGPELIETLEPVRHSRSTNPFDLGVDAQPADYRTALVPLLKDRGNDAILAIHVPTARAAAEPVAEAIAEAASAARKGGYRAKPVFAVSFGEDEAAARVFAKARIPLFATDADAVAGFTHLVRYREAQDDLMRTPDSLPRDFRPKLGAARAIIARALASGESWLGPRAVAGLLEAYDIPLVPSVLAPDPEAAAAAAWPILAQGDTVALKLVSPDIVHKSDVGGVRLGLTSEADLKDAAQSMVARARVQRPEARLTGFAVQPMIPRGDRRELIAGLAEDPVFGPVVVFGRGGTAVEVIDDRALALPPLDLSLAEALIQRTRVARRLVAYRDVPAADSRAIALVLVKIAQMAADLPELRELDINPLLAGADGVLGVDARIRVARDATVIPSSLRGGAGVGVVPPDSPAASGATLTSTASPEGGEEGLRRPQRSSDHDPSHPQPHPEVPERSGGLEEGLQPAARSLELSVEAAGAAPQDEGSDGKDPQNRLPRLKPARSRLAIRPYPVEWERTVTLRGRVLRVRPVRPDDETMFGAFFRALDPEDVRLRFFQPIKEFSHAFLARLTQLDYARAIAFVAIDDAVEEEHRMLGAVRLHADANHETGEFAILVRSDVKGYGLGFALMRMMIEWARAEGLSCIEGTVLAENRPMLAVCRRLGFEITPSADDPTLRHPLLKL